MKLVYTISVVAFALLVSTGFANTWIDERFEGTAFTQGNGGNTGQTPGATLDTNADTNPPNQTPSPLVSSGLTHSGLVVSNKAFEGTHSYKMTAGQTLSQAAGTYANPTNGSFQFYQFAVNVDPIPAAGNVATFRYNLIMDASSTYSLFVRLDSTGSAVNIVAGEDLKNSPAVSATIGTLSSINDWKYITVMVQKDPGAKTDVAPRATASLGAKNQGAYFFCSSNTEGTSLPLAGDGTAFASQNWGWTVSSGTVYIDDLYWDGGWDGSSNTTRIAQTAPRYPSNGMAAAVKDWALY